MGRHSFRMNSSFRKDLIEVTFHKSNDKKVHNNKIKLMRIQNKMI